MASRKDPYEYPGNTREKVKQKHAELETNKKEMKALLDAKKDHIKEPILDMKATEISAKVKDGSLKAEDALVTFVDRCFHYIDRNFIADFILEAFQDVAKLTDEKKASPIYAVPISLKECIGVKGHDTTFGLLKHSFCPAKEDAVIVKVLRSVGAIPFMTTSMAQGGLDLDCSNPLFGLQRNAHFEGYLGGGSSGGEGIALGLKASILGVGTDIGGSIRFPAAFNGVCSLKPTVRRLSMRGVLDPFLTHCLQLQITIGPLGRFVEDLVNFMKATLCPLLFQLDPLVIPLPFNNDLYEGSHKLKIGYFTCFKQTKDNAMVIPVPAVQRAVQESADKLKNLGYDVVEFEVPTPEYAYSLYARAIFNDAGYALIEMMKNEPFNQDYMQIKQLIGQPSFVKSKCSFVAEWMFGPQVETGVKATAGSKSGKSAGELLKAIHDYVHVFLDAMGDIDLLLSPIYSVPVARKDVLDVINKSMIPYAAMYNLLEMPAGVLPVTKTTQDDLDKAQALAKKFHEAKDKVNAKVFETQDKLGLPVSVQVAAKPYREELVLRVMKALET
ncbi:hypothetical protein Ciccas_013100 [Cichlidogyrus casuarinus]|uniref:Amidase domain-containing protein n=1 Tax=Cichlidogyrus casuarinus TaxID=1844966 RepID=A0ABD2PLK3_9PLAT